MRLPSLNQCKTIYHLFFWLLSSAPSQHFQIRVFRINCVRDNFLQQCQHKYQNHLPQSSSIDTWWQAPHIHNENSFRLFVMQTISQLKVCERKFRSKVDHINQTHFVTSEAKKQVFHRLCMLQRMNCMRHGAWKTLSIRDVYAAKLNSPFPNLNPSSTNAIEYQLAVWNK